MTGVAVDVLLTKRMREHLMSDLRDRIAAAVLASLESESEWVGDDGKWLFGVSTNGYEVADAVIAELNLTEEGGVIVGCNHD